MTAVTLTTGVAGTVNFSGGSITAGVTNDGHFNILGGGTRTFIDPIQNNGTFKVTATKVVYTGMFTNTGGYYSDPAINIFMSDLVIDPTGFLVGGVGDEFYVGGDFLNASTNNSQWNTDAAKLCITGAGSHQFGLAGADLGAGGFAHNFGWGDFCLDSGVSLTLFDSNTTSGAALYVGLFELGGGISQLSQILGAFNIYYDADLDGNKLLFGGQDYILGGGGHLFAFHPNAGGSAPEPGTLLLMFLGLGGLAAWRRRIAKTRAAA